MIVNLFRKKIPDDTEKKKIENFIDLSIIQRKIEDLSDRMEKLEIKALESRKIYYKKLKNLYGDEEKKEEENNIKTNVFLSPNGTPIEPSKNS